MLFLFQFWGSFGSLGELPLPLELFCEVLPFFFEASEPCCAASRMCIALSTKFAVFSTPMLQTTSTPAAISNPTPYIISPIGSAASIAQSQNIEDPHAAAAVPKFPLGSTYMIGLFPQYAYRFRLKGSLASIYAHASCWVNRPFAGL